MPRRKKDVSIPDELVDKLLKDYREPGDLLGELWMPLRPSGRTNIQRLARFELVIGKLLFRFLSFPGTVQETMLNQAEGVGSSVIARTLSDTLCKLVLT